MSKKVGMTLQEHLEHAKVIAKIVDDLRRLTSEYGDKFGYSKHQHKQALRTLRALDSLRSSLDDAYHKIATDKDFEEHGHVYYKINLAQQDTVRRDL